MATRHRSAPRSSSHPRRISRADLLPAFLQVAQAAVDRAAKQAEDPGVLTLVERAKTCLRAAHELAVIEAA
ncbi:MAG: hypothetical protein R3F62_31350 [Planctomycetota bacterium]